MTWSRRALLKAGGALAGVSAAALLTRAACGRDLTAAQDAATPGNGVETTTRRIALLNLHTDERVETLYFRDGAYLPEALSAIETCLRDFRTGGRHPIDPSLMDYLVDVAGTVGTAPEFSVISGYRSQRGLHMEGRAIDVRIPGIDSADLAARTLGLKRGGVGYYRASDFVHLDTGPFRTWKG
jgi:uncharacterized protein YcbK (DUF882 family)